MQSSPRWCQSCSLYLNIPFSVPSLFATHFLCPHLLHNTHLTTSFPIAPSSATTIPNLSVLIPLPVSFVVLVMQLPWCLVRYYSPKGLQTPPQLSVKLGLLFHFSQNSPFTTCETQPSCMVLSVTLVIFSLSYQSCSALSHVMSSNFPHLVPSPNLRPGLSQ